MRRATCQRLLGNFQAGLDDALQALLLAQKTPNSRILEAESEREIGLNKQGLGQNLEAKAHMERSLACYQELKDQKNIAVVQIGLGFLEMLEGNFRKARSLLQQSYQFWNEMGNLNRLVGLCNNLGVLDHLTGAYLEAFQWFGEASEYARQSSNLRESAFTLASLGDLALDLGAHSRAERYITDSFGLAERIGDSYLQIYLQLTTASLARIKGDYETARSLLDSASYQLQDSPSGDEQGWYHLENGQLLLEEGRQVLAQNEFQAALEIFSRNNLPVETCLCQVQLARLDCLGGDLSQAGPRLEAVQQQVRSLGTIQPLVPALSRDGELLSCLESHLPRDLFTAELVRAVSDFNARRPVLLEELGFGHPLLDASQQPFLDITAMGRVSVLRHGAAISVPEWTKQKTVRELFFYLLSYPEGASREEICLEFWPDSLPEQLKKQFKNALYRLRRAVGSDTILYHQPTRLYHFNRHLDYRYDVEEFNKFLELAEAESNQERRVQILRQAADLYRHPFAPALEGIWSEPVRYRLNFDYERAMLSIAEWHFSQEKYEAALQTVEDLLLALPGQEEAWRLAMRSYAEKADRAGIERAFQRCRQALAQDLDAEPSEETRSLYQELMS
jgi:DNA-binding SARP family transcriptional activator